MSQKIIDLHDDYQKGLLDRREFIRKLSAIAGGTVAALALLPKLENDYAKAQTVRKDDPRLDTGYIEYDGETGKVRASFAVLKKEGKYPGVVVIHENRGLNPHIEDVNRRMALEGFVAIAPDALSPVGGTPDDSNKARSMLYELDSDDTRRNFIAAVKYLKTHERSTGKVGCIGFCWGGGMSNQLAVHSPDLIAAVPYYGRQAAIEDVPKIKASLLLHYAGNDQRINTGIPEYEEALNKAGVDYTIHMYEGAAHAFNNDTNEARYNREAAELAWKRTVKFLTEKLKS